MSICCFLQGSEEEAREEIKEKKVEEQSKADDSDDESSVEEKGSPLNSSEEEKLADSSDSLKDFVVEEEGQKKDDDQEEEAEAKDKAFLSHLPRQCKTTGFCFAFNLVSQYVYRVSNNKKKIYVCLHITVITGSQLTHFQVVVKALLINVLDSSFLKSLYSMFFKLLLIFVALELSL